MQHSHQFKNQRGEKKKKQTQSEQIPHHYNTVAMKRHSVCPGTLLSLEASTAA